MGESTEAIPDVEDTATEDLETQQGKIADQLAELSSAEGAPAGFKIRNDPFEASDVDFASSGWLLRVLQVQAWLNPDAEIDPKAAESAPLAAAKEFFGAIGADDPKACVCEVQGVVRLTQLGADHLGGRLDTAISLQQEFHDLLETLNNKQATAQWVERWEEDDDTVTATEPIKAKSDVWRISDFAGKATRGLLNLSPSYQRGDVWPTKDAQKLIESILRGIPLPSIILLRPKSKNKQAKYEVVDGKQRLTSILRFIGEHP